MKLPMPAPNFDELWNEIIQRPENFTKILSAEVNDAEYLHWDQLRYKEVPKGFNHREWWLALKLQRRKQSRRIGLVDKSGRNFSFSMTDELLRMSEEIARRAGALNSPGSLKLGQASEVNYVVRSLVEEAVTSSQLEGASTSRRDAVAMLESGRRPVTKSEIMILNNYQAMQQIKESYESDMSPEAVKELHRVLTDGTLDDPSEAGKLETAEHERVAVWDDSSGEVLHRPPAAELLPQRLEDLCSFANGQMKNEPYFPPVVRAVIVHFMFGYDHYFVDGNGRTARTMFYWSMLREGYWLSEYVTISKLLRKAPSRYSNAYLYTEDDESDLTYFIHYQLKIFLRALDELDEYIDVKLKETKELRRALEDPSSELTYRQADIVRHLVDEDSSGIRAAAYARRFKVSEQTARNDLNQLSDMGYLVKRRQGSSNIWMASESLVKQMLNSNSQKTQN